MVLNGQLRDPVVVLPDKTDSGPHWDSVSVWTLCTGIKYVPLLVNETLLPIGPSIA